jgi:transcriptional regulator with XRE-family HTH domain
MTAVVQEQGAAAQPSRRPASGIAIDPGQLERMRDLVPLSREDLARETGRLLFDSDRFADVLSDRVPADAKTARALWLALGVEPFEIINGLGVNPSLTRAQVPRWLRASDGWDLDLNAVNWLMVQRGWSKADLGDAVSRYWFSRDSVNKIERGERRPKARTLRAFCEILQCTPAQLMPGSRPLPEGQTSARQAMLAFNAGMREYADARGISYRRPGPDGKPGRIAYPPELHDEYSEFLANGGAEDTTPVARDPEAALAS